MIYLQIHSIDTIISNEQLRSKAPASLVPKDDRKYGGLPQTLHLTCGSRVMLKRNIMAAQGLVNEQHGTRSEKRKSILFNIKCRMGQLLGIILMNYMKKK